MTETDPRPQSHLRATATKIELATGHAFLLLQIDIACPACGRQSHAFAGHHLRALRDAIIEAIDRHPELTGKDGDAQVIERLRMEGTAPADPTTN